MFIRRSHLARWCHSIERPNSGGLITPPLLATVVPNAKAARGLKSLEFGACPEGKVALGGMDFVFGVLTPCH
jgi:hypothetical protein